MKSQKRPATKETTTKPQKIPTKLPRGRGRGVRKKFLRVPAILLEGDPSPDPIREDRGGDYDLGASESARPVPSVEPQKELPKAYGEKTLLLMARDPHWLYAHWDLTREQLQHYNELSVDHHLILRVYLDHIAGEPVADIHVHPESRNWFVHVGLGGKQYIAELGYHNDDQTWVTICNSKPALTPLDDLSQDTSVRFATIPLEAAFEKDMQAINNEVSASAPPQSFLDVSPSNSQWTPTQEEALAQAIRTDEPRGGGIGSLEITEVIRRELISELAPEGAAQFSQPSNWSGSVPGISHPQGGWEVAKQFRFEINAELIVYGATEPDANVTIGGRPIKLRPDGTFSYRFALPDGSYPLSVVAMSPDNSDCRSAELTCSRKTEYRGEVGVHPQDPALREPNVGL